MEKKCPQDSRDCFEIVQLCERVFKKYMKTQYFSDIFARLRM
jgi:hypothetical protein